MNFPMKLFTVKHPQVSARFRSLLLGALLALLWPSGNLRAQSDNGVFPPKPEPAVYVHDYAGWLQAGERQALELKLRRYWDSTSTQIIVMIRPDIGDYDKATYATELGERWGVGQKGKDNGIVMLVKSEAPDRGIFIATGYGTEGALPDILAGRIIRNTMAPFFRQQRYYEGIDAGLNDIIRAMSGEFKAGKSDNDDPDAIWVLVFVGLILLGLFIFFYFMAKRFGTIYTDQGPRPGRLNRDQGGGWIIGGGGWSGGGWGGGSSGGGGWGGGSDGGSFGGGSFGGGGAGGDW